MSKKTEEEKRLVKRTSSRKWRQENPEKVKESNAKYHRNKDKMTDNQKTVKREYDREWRQKNPEKVKAYAAKYRKGSKDKIATYRKNNKDKITAYNKEYQKNNNEKITAYKKEYYRRQQTMRELTEHEKRMQAMTDEEFADAFGMSKEDMLAPSLIERCEDEIEELKLQDGQELQIQVLQGIIVRGHEKDRKYRADVRAYMLADDEGREDDRLAIGRRILGLEVKE